MYNIGAVQYEAYENNDIYGFWWSYLHRLSVIQIVIVLMRQSVLYTIYSSTWVLGIVNCVRLDKPDIGRKDEVGGIYYMVQKSI